jgi:hypothetical protein
MNVDGKHELLELLIIQLLRIYEKNEKKNDHIS